MNTDLSAALDRVAQRFIARMPALLEAMRRAATDDESAGQQELRQGAHNIAGLAPTLGMTGTGAAAATLEAMVSGSVPPPTDRRLAAIDAIDAAFNVECAARGIAG